MTRLGKIARLPRELREELNVRLNNGEEGKELVAWLNGLPKAKAVLAAKFEGRPISEQNLSEWRKVGYEDWVRHQENFAYAGMLKEMAGDLEEEAGEGRLEEHLATLLAMSLARLLREAEESTDEDYRRKTVLEVGRQLAQLRRGNQQAARLRLAREQLEFKQDESDAKLDQKREAEAEYEALWEMAKAEAASKRAERDGEAGWMPAGKGRERAEDKERSRGLAALTRVQLLVFEHQ